jgi:hypothetical protein
MVGHVRDYGAIAVKDWTGRFAAQAVVPVRIASESGSRTKYTAVRSVASGSTSVVMCVANGLSGPGLLTVSSRFLRSVTAYGVGVRSNDTGQVSVVMDLAFMAVTIVVEGSGMMSDVFFEIVYQTPGEGPSGARQIGYV